MHVAFFSPTWANDAHPSGIVTYVRSMREELRCAGHRVSVFTNASELPALDLHPVIPTVPRAMAAWIRSRLGSGRPEILRWGEVIARSVRTVHESDPIDVLEMEESFGWFGSVARGVPVPLVVKLHGPAFLTLVEEDARTSLATMKIEAEGRAFQSARVLTAPSQGTLDATAERFGLVPSIARRVVNPVSLSARAPIWDLRRCERETLLFVGRFDKLKGGDIVLTAFAKLLAKNPRLRLLFVGPDAGVPDEQGRRVHLRETIAKLLPGELSTRVTTTGKLSPDDIYPLRTQAFATIVASRWENQSYTLLEAMMQGCPVITSDTGGQGEVVSDRQNGLLCRTADPEDLAAKIQYLLDHPEDAARLGAGARRYALAEHSPRVVVDKTLQVYREAVALAARNVPAVAALRG